MLKDISKKLEIGLTALFLLTIINEIFYNAPNQATSKLLLFLCGFVLASFILYNYAKSNRSKNQRIDPSIKWFIIFSFIVMIYTILIYPLISDLINPLYTIPLSQLILIIGFFILAHIIILFRKNKDIALLIRPDKNPKEGANVIFKIIAITVVIFLVLLIRSGVNIASFFSILGIVFMIAIALIIYKLQKVINNKSYINKLYALLWVLLIVALMGVFSLIIYNLIIIVYIIKIVTSILGT